ncbi:hypothetical protein FQR65_LT16010 [Abscondita terminalis]|nr:hypothetical protein FQR65_LT16010 [Abscondita terminalis]
MSGKRIRFEEGYIQTQSNNLPKVDSWMVAQYFANSECFSAEEMRGVKSTSAGRENYGDEGVGYVQIEREGTAATVKCHMCPEHKVKKLRSGCKHAVAALMWVHRLSEEPSPTECQCYWRKPKLSAVGTSIKFVTVKDFGGIPVQPAEGSEFLTKIQQALEPRLGNTPQGEIFKIWTPAISLQMTRTGLNLKPELNADWRMHEWEWRYRCGGGVAVTVGGAHCWLSRVILILRTNPMLLLKTDKLKSMVIGL